jgi:MFS family permease
MKQEKYREFDSIKAWVVCITSALFFFFVFIQMNCLTVLESHFMQKFSLTSVAGLDKMYFYGNVLCLFPAGMILDRVSTRKMLLIGMALVTVATTSFAFADSYWVVALSRFLIGVGGAFCLLGPVRLVSRWFPSHKISFLVGIIVTFAMLGGMVAQRPLGFLVSPTEFGYAHAMQVVIGFGVLCWFLIFFLVKDSPKDRDIEEHSHDEIHQMGFWVSISKVLRNPQNWLAGIYASLINLPVFWLGAFKGVDYLSQVDHLKNSQAQVINGLLFIGLIVGSPLFGYLSGRLRRRKLPMVAGAVGSIVILSAIMWSGLHSESALSALFFLLGVVISSQVIAYPLVVEINPLSLTGTAEGVASVLIMLGGLTISVMKLLLQHSGDYVLKQTNTFYSLADWHLAFIGLMGAFVLALCCAFLTKETRCKHVGNA